MSSYQVLSQVSRQLQRLLWQGISDELARDSALHDTLDRLEQIVFTNPTEAARDSSNRLSLWLYRIAENEFLKNGAFEPAGAPAPSARPAPRRRDRFPPLSLNLFYLMTPLTASGEGDLLLLGKAMQIFYDNPSVPLDDDLFDIHEQLHITLCRLTLEELTRIWEALREPYRLSVCYEVRATRVDSQRVLERGRVVHRDAELGERPKE